jgi:hypothetical protein
MPALRQCRRSTAPTVLLALAVAALVVGLLAACQGDQPVAPRPSLAAGNGPNGNNGTVQVTPASDTLHALHQTVQLTANLAVGWSSLTPSITSVDASGVVTAVGPGLGLIQALAKNHKADTAQVLVRQIAASVVVIPDSIGIAFCCDTLTAAAGDSNAYPIPNPFVIWASDDTTIATVFNGVVTPVADSGSTTIRATVDHVTGTARVDIVAAPFP